MLVYRDYVRYCNWLTLSRFPGVGFAALSPHSRYVWHSPDWAEHRWWEGTGAVWRAPDFNKTVRPSHFCSSCSLLVVPVCTHIYAHPHTSSNAAPITSIIVTRPASMNAMPVFTQRTKQSQHDAYFYAKASELSTQLLS